MVRRVGGFAGKKARPIGGPVKYEGKQMAKELLAWSKKEDSINICGFCADHGYIAQLILDKRKSSPEFREAYEVVRLRLAERRERLLNTDMLHSTSFSKYQSCYDPFIDKFEEKKKDQEAKRKKEIAQCSTEAQMNIADILKGLDLGEFTQK